MVDKQCIPGVPNTAGGFGTLHSIGSTIFSHNIAIGILFILCLSLLVIIVLAVVQRHRGLRFGAMVTYRNGRNGRNGKSKKTPLTYLMQATLSLVAVSVLALGIMTLSPNVQALDSCDPSSNSNQANNTHNTGNNGNGSNTNAGGTNGAANNGNNNGTTPTTPAPLTMQSLTKDYCTNHMQTYTASGSDEGNILKLTDSRGGTTQTYQVAKLADGNCWMLDNLKLGSTTTPITLTPSDSNVATNFTLPKLNDGTRTPDYSSNPGNDRDTPYTYGPVPGDTGSGTTNYGYLYNFSAATAGETRTTLPAGSGDAQNSICPSGWRMSSGGDWDSPNNDFSNLNAKMAGFSGVTDSGYTDGNNYTFQSNWQNNGPFKGVFSGSWGGVFYYQYQGDLGILWSRSAHPDWGSSAMNAGFYSDIVNPGGVIWDRGDGLAVRCLLK